MSPCLANHRVLLYLLFIIVLTFQPITTAATPTLPSSWTSFKKFESTIRTRVANKSCKWIYIAPDLGFWEYNDTCPLAFFFFSYITNHSEDVLCSCNRDIVKKRKGKRKEKVGGQSRVDMYTMSMSLPTEHSQQLRTKGILQHLKFEPASTDHSDGNRIGIQKPTRSSGRYILF